MVNSRNKVELNRLSQVNNNEQNFLAALNENLKRIQVAINDTLSRTGVIPNQMEEVLDMNGHRIVNVGRAVEPTDVVTKQDIQDIIDAAEEAIAQLDHLVEDAKVALQLYVEEYVLPLVDTKLVGTYIYGGTFDSTTATASLTDRAKARLNTQLNSIVLTNDTTDITGYKDNEGINYYVSADGTFASLTLHEGDILWSTGASWKKIDNSETVIPDATESTKGIVKLSSTGLATVGTDDATAMTPLKVKKAVSAQTFNSLSSSQESTLLANGTYLNRLVESDTVFEAEDGAFKKFTDTVTTQDITWSIPGVFANAIAYGDEKFVIAPTNRPVIDDNYDVGYYSTDNGLTWTGCTADQRVGDGCSDIAYGNGTFVAVIYSNVNKCYYSLNGKHWSIATMPTTQRWASVVYGDGKFVAVPAYVYGAGGQYGAYSLDGVNWTSMTMPVVGDYKGLVYGNGKFVAGISTTTTPNTIVYSLNGSTWSTATYSGVDDLCILNIAYGNGKFVASCKDTNNMTVLSYMYSSDGITWSEGSLPEFTGSQSALYNIPGVAFGGGLFLYFISNYYTQSSDGITWSEWKPLGASSIVNSAVFAKDTWLTSDRWTATSAYRGAASTTHEYALTPLSYSKEDIDDKKYIQNNATQSSSVAILGSSSSYQSVAIGLGSSAGNFGTAIGRGAKTNNNAVNMALGYGAETGSSVTESIQIGRGTNTESKTLKVGFLENNYKLLDGTTGKIPAERYTIMTGATSSVAGTVGAVPAPTTADVNKYLKGDGTWGDVSVQPATYDSSTSTITL